MTLKITLIITTRPGQTTCAYFIERTSKIAKFMGPIWAQLVPVGPRKAPCWPDVGPVSRAGKRVLFPVLRVESVHTRWIKDYTCSVTGLIIYSSCSLIKADTPYMCAIYNTSVRIFEIQQSIQLPIHIAHTLNAILRVSPFRAIYQYRAIIIYCCALYTCSSL